MPKKTPLVMPRRCKYCRVTFTPERPQDAKRAKFCCSNHQKAYWRYGALPFDKMRERIMKEVRKIVREELQAFWKESNQPPTVSA